MNMNYDLKYWWCYDSNQGKTKQCLWLHAHISPEARQVRLEELL